MLDGLPRSVRFLAKDGDKPALLPGRLLARWIGGSEHVGSPGVAQIAAPGDFHLDDLQFERPVRIGQGILHRLANGALAGHHRRIRDHDVSVICVVGGNAARVLAAPVLDKGGNLAFAQSAGIRLAAIGCRRLRATGQSQQSQCAEYRRVTRSLPVSWTFHFELLASSDYTCRTTRTK